MSKSWSGNNGVPLDYCGKPISRGGTNMMFTMIKLVISSMIALPRHNQIAMGNKSGCI